MTMPTEPTMPTERSATVTPYLAVADGNAAIAFYVEAFDAQLESRFVMPDERTVGHAELRIGTARVFVSDELPDLGVLAPSTRGGTSVTLYLEVVDVDSAFARAVAAGATPLSEPADQAHGNRHGTLRDPFGHRWMLSQPIGPAPGAARSAGDRPTRGGIWAALIYADAEAGIRLLVDVFGFTTQLVVADAEPGKIAHSELRWPEGGTVQVASAARAGNVYSARPTGTNSLYVITADPQAVWERCRDAGLEVVAEPLAPDYDPGGMVFSVRDFEGNLWSFGTYGGE